MVCVFKKKFNLEIQTTQKNAIENFIIGIFDDIETLDIIEKKRYRKFYNRYFRRYRTHDSIEKKRYRKLHNRAPVS